MPRRDLAAAIPEEARTAAVAGAVRRRCRAWGRADGFGSAVVGAELALGAAQPTGQRWPCSPGRDAKAMARGCTGAGGRRRRGHTGGRSAGARRLGFRPLG